MIVLVVAGFGLLSLFFCVFRSFCVFFYYFSDFLFVYCFCYFLLLFVVVVVAVFSFILCFVIVVIVVFAVFVVIRYNSFFIPACLPLT